MYSLSVIKLLKLHLLISRVDLDLEITFTLLARVSRAADYGESVRVIHLLVELDRATQHLQVRDTGLHDQIALVQLAHDLALLAGDHPTDKVLTLERTS